MLETETPASLCADQRHSRLSTAKLAIQLPEGKAAAQLDELELLGASLEHGGPKFNRLYAQGSAMIEAILLEFPDAEGSQSRRKALLAFFAEARAVSERWHRDFFYPQILARAFRQLRVARLQGSLQRLRWRYRRAHLPGRVTERD